MYQLLLQAPIPILLLHGSNYRVEAANDAYQQIVGVSSENLLGKPFFETHAAPQNHGVKTLFDTVMQSGVPFFGTEQERFIIKNGTTSTVFVNVAYQPIRNEDNLVTGLMVVINDVSAQVNARKQVQDSEKRYNKMLMQSPYAFAVFKGKDMVLALANDSVKAMWGKGNDVEGKTFLEVLPEVADQGFPALLDAVYTTGIPFYGDEMRVMLLRKGKMEETYFNFVYQPYQEADETISGVTLIAYEVTAQVISKKAVAESELYFRTIAEFMPEKVTNATPDGTVIFYNKSWQEYTGASQDTLINDGWIQWIHPEDVDETTASWLKAVATGDNFEMELRMLNHQGEYRWHSSHARSVRDDDGHIKLWIGSNSDIHHQKEEKEALEKAVFDRTQELQKANATLQQKNVELLQKNKEIAEAKENRLSGYARSLIEASLDPLITISTDGKIMDVNEAMAHATGKTRGQLIGTDFSFYFTHPTQAEMVYQKVFDEGFVLNYPLTIKDHKLTDVLFNGSVYKDENDNVVGAVVVARDVTEEKKAEKELTAAKELAELASTNAEVAQKKAEEATQIAESAMKSKQQFLSNMSHEIRTPMNAIIGFTKVLLKMPQDAKQKEYLTAIKVSGDSLIVLINDILDLAKVDAGKMAFEEIPFRMSVSLAAMLHVFETKVQEKNLKLIKTYDKKIPEILLGDPVRLHQIILNLVSNAVKFTSTGSVTVGVRMLSQTAEKASLEFSVKDTGIGITADKMETIFENFQQATSETARLFGGTGLGLAISKQLIEQQGGNIKVHSTVGKGTTFSFTLDFQKTEASIEVEPDLEKMAEGSKKIRILVAEDIALNQLLIKTILDDFGFEREIADNGRIAIEKMKKKEYDLILMDLQMPEMNGFEATDYIRNTLKSKIPIIALTADVTTMDLSKCRAVGMDDYIAKPIDEKLLYNKIISLIKKPIPVPVVIIDANQKEVIKKIKCTNLEYLNLRTKSNPALMLEMMNIYLEQTPPLLLTMKKSVADKDWTMLHAAVHKLIPSFSIMGIHQDFEVLAKKIQELAKTQAQLEGIHDLVLQLEAVCVQACEELEEEIGLIKRKLNG